jgi:hypothetical protein
MRREVPSKAQIKSRKSSAVDFINTIGQKRTNHRIRKSANVRYSPKAT